MCELANSAAFVCLKDTQHTCSKSKLTLFCIAFCVVYQTITAWPLLLVALSAVCHFDIYMYKWSLDMIVCCECNLPVDLFDGMTATAGWGWL